MTQQKSVPSNNELQIGSTVVPVFHAEVGAVQMLVNNDPVILNAYKERSRVIFRGASYLIEHLQSVSVGNCAYYDLVLYEFR